MPETLTQFVEVAKTADLPAGRARAFAVGETKVAVYHTAAGFFATENVSPHRGGPLGEGDLIGNEIVCPWHLWSFDVATGLCGGNPEISVATVELRIDDDRILVKVP